MLHLCAAQRHDVIFPAFRLRGSTEIFYYPGDTFPIHNQAIHFRWNDDDKHIEINENVIFVTYF
jgi:hypothetical protein